MNGCQNLRKWKLGYNLLLCTKAQAPKASPGFNIKDWLTRLEVPEYTDVFVTNGYSTRGVVKILDENDLDYMKVTLIGHRKLLLQNAKKL